VRDLGFSPDGDHLVRAGDFQHPGHPALRTQQHQAAAALFKVLAASTSTRTDAESAKLSPDTSIVRCTVPPPAGR
jgi:hypothetical protein